MCGIIGYSGKREALPILLKGLARLEYRGYDSAGIAVSDNKDKMKIVKAEGKLSALLEKTKTETALSGTCGIGHTRWATHGAPSERNAHPHTSETVTAVHNGIIENAKILKKELLAEGYSFDSETDTEAAVKLMDYYYKKTGEPLLAMICAMKKIRGSYAFAVMFSGEPHALYAMKKDSPLAVGIGKNESFLASDVPAFLQDTRKVCYMNDRELVRIEGADVHFYDSNGAEIEKIPSEINWTAEAAEKNGFPHFMLKEIYEQPKAVRDTLNAYIADGRIDFSSAGLSDSDIRRFQRIWVVACGSAYHVGAAAQYVIEALAKIPVRVEYASEFRYREPLLQTNDLVIIISQSGETADSLGALREAKRRGAETLAIVNVVGSSIATEADRVIYTPAGPEIAVATTKAYSAQLAVCDMLALAFANVKKTLPADRYRILLQSLSSLPKKMEQILQKRESLYTLAHRFKNIKDAFFIGRGADYALALEGSLKLKEISYIHSEAYAAGELKHGTMSLIEKDTLAVGMMTQKDLYEKTVSNMAEMKSRGAYLAAFTSFSAEERGFDTVFSLPETEDLFAPNLAVLPLQLLAYEFCAARALDPDKPRSLAKSVTVE